MPDFDDSLKLCERANPHWIHYFKTHFGSLLLGLISLEDNLAIQSKKLGDFLAIVDFDNKEDRFITIETKIHKPEYYDYYKKQRRVLFEIMGNIRTHRPGSAFLECKADIYATAYLNKDRYPPLIGVNVFHTRATQGWLRTRLHLYPKIKSNTGGVYETEFILPPLSDIPLACRAMSYV